MKSSRWSTFAVLAAAAALSIGASRAVALPQANAQQAGQAPMSPADHAKARLGIVASAVGDLSDDEKAKILAIYQKAYQTQDDMRAKGQSGEPVRDVMEKADDDVKAVLTSEQKSKFPSGRQLRAAGI